MEIPSNFVLSPLPVEDLAERLGTPAAEAILATLPEAIRRARLGAYLTEDQAQAETGLSKRQLRHLRATRRVEYAVVGRSCIYPTNSLFGAIDAGRVPVREGVPAH